MTGVFVYKTARGDLVLRRQEQPEPFASYNLLHTWNINVRRLFCNGTWWMT